MLTSAVSYVPYCEHTESQGGEPERTTYSVCSPSIASSAWLGISTAVEDLTEVHYYKGGRRSTEYTDGSTIYSTLTVQDNETPIDDSENVETLTDSLVCTCKPRREIALQYSRGGPDKFVNTYALPLYYGFDYSPEIFDEFTGQGERDIVKMMNYPQLGVYTDPVDVQEESAEVSHSSKAIVTRASLYSRTEECEGSERTMACKGEKTLVYNNCVNDPLIEDDDIGFAFTTEVTGVSRNSPICQQWFKEYAGCYYPAATLTRLHRIGDAESGYTVFSFPTIVPNCYYEDISKSSVARPRIGGVVCSSATEKSVVSIGSMFTLGKKKARMEGESEAKDHYDYVTFGNGNEIMISGAMLDDGTYDVPPSLDGIIPLPSTELYVYPMENSRILGEAEQPWNKYMLSCNPAFVKIANISGIPDDSYRTAYKTQQSKVSYEDGQCSTESTQSLGYTFPYTASEGDTRVMTIPGCARSTSVFNAKINSTYTIAQAGNYIVSGINYNVPGVTNYDVPVMDVNSHLRQVKEIFPARITSLRCHIDPEAQQISGTSNNKPVSMEPSSPLTGSPCSLLDVETVASPRLFSFSPIDRQFELQNVTQYNVPIMTTASVMEPEILEDSRSSFLVSGDIGGSFVSRWPRSANWAQSHFEVGVGETDEAFTGMGFFYEAGERMKYGLISADGQLDGNTYYRINAIEWGGHIRVVHAPGHDATTGNSRVVQSTQARVRGSSTTSYFFADISK